MTISSRRLAKSAARATEIEQSKSLEEAARRHRQEDLVALIQAVVVDWNSRIAPGIIRSTQMANQALTGTGFSLMHKVGGTTTVTVGRGPRVPALPNITITGALPEVRRQPGVRPMIPTVKQLVIGVSTTGRITVTGMKPDGDFGADEFDTAKIESIIADFVEDLVPNG